MLRFAALTCRLISLHGKMLRTHRHILNVLLLSGFCIGGCDFTPDFAEFQSQEEEIEIERCGGMGILCDVAGIAGEAGSGGLGSNALLAQLNFPIDVAMAPLTLAQTGDVFVLDWQNHAIRKITPGGDIFPFIGSGLEGDGVVAGPGERIDLKFPTDLEISPRGDFYVSDWKNSKVKVFDAINVALTQSMGQFQGFEGDGGDATQASMDMPSSVTFDPDGNMYISDQRNHRIRQVDKDGIITTYAGSQEGFEDGNKADALFRFIVGDDTLPGGKLSINTHDWSLYIADTENHAIRRLNFFTGHITTVVGTGAPGYSGDGGNARKAQLNTPTDVVFREDHHIYIADSGNHVIRKVDPFGMISTLAGTGEPGYSPDETPAKEARLNSPMGIYYDEVNQVLYIADTFNHQIKRVEDN